MKVLTITNMWPIKQAPYYGVFVKEQVEALKRYHPEINNKVYFINGKKSKLNYLWSIFKINWILTFNKYDVVHVHYALSGLFLLFNPFIKTPVVLTLHGSDFNAGNMYLRKLVKIIIKKTSHIIYLNNEMLNEFVKYNKELHHIPCGVDTNLFKPISKGNKSDSYNIVFPSSKLRPVKNYKFFEKVVKHLKLKYKIEINIIILHNKSRKEINEILNYVDLLCLTSISEGSPQVIKEAMACNTPIVASKVGDVDDLLHGVSNCYVINTYEVEDFSKAILKILNLNYNNRLSDGRPRVFKLGVDEKSTSLKLFNLYSSISEYVKT